MLSNEEIVTRVKEKLTAAEVPADEAVRQLRFGRDFSAEGLYVYSDEENYYIKEVGANGSCGDEHSYQVEKELIRVLTWNCLVTYIYRTNRFQPNSKELAFEYLKKINDDMG